MSQNSSIEWTDATWNPVRGCTKISPGCKHCYAETFAERFRGVKGHPYEQGFDLRLVPEKLAEPLRWRKSKMIFVNSMSDLFTMRFRTITSWPWHRSWWRPNAYLPGADQTVGTSSQAPQYKASLCAEQRHIWWGVSVEDKKYGLPPHRRLCETQMRRFVCFPLNHC